jgi:hypothetical protein
MQNRRWILLKAVFATALINAIVNAAIAWFSIQGQAQVATWGLPLVETSLFWSAIGTLFLLPLITCVLTTTAIRHDIATGSVEPVGWLRVAYPRATALPVGRSIRGAVLGVLAVAALGPLVALDLVAGGASEFSSTQFIAFQTALAVVVGALVTPIVAFCAMADSA